MCSMTKFSTLFDRTSVVILAGKTKSAFSFIESPTRFVFLIVFKFIEIIMVSDSIFKNHCPSLLENDTPRSFGMSGNMLSKFPVICVYILPKISS